MNDLNREMVFQIQDGTETESFNAFNGRFRYRPPRDPGLLPSEAHHRDELGGGGGEGQNCSGAEDEHGEVTVNSGAKKKTIYAVF